MAENLIQREQRQARSKRAFIRVGTNLPRTTTRRTNVPDWTVDDLDLETRPRAIQIEITAGDIRQRLLRLAELRKAGFHLPEGRQLTVEAVASTGTTRFKTTVAEPPRLRARSEIAAFYKGAGVRSGDLILFEEVGPDTYRISKRSISEAARHRVSPLSKARSPSGTGISTIKLMVILISATTLS